MNINLNLKFAGYPLIISLLLLTIFVSQAQASSTNSFHQNENKSSLLPDFLLFDHDFKPIRNSNLKGHWTLFFFGYLNCPDVCPTTLQTLATSVELLKNEQNAKNIQVIFVSVDPWRDTPEKLKQYVQYFNSDFIGASADTPQLNILTNFFKVIYYNNRTDNSSKEYDVAHSDQLLLVNPDGEYSGYFKAPLNSQLIAEDLAKIINKSN